MQKFNLPVLLPPGSSCVMTQPFGQTSNPIEPQGPNGEAHFHYGIDLTFGSPADTFGTPIVCPFGYGTMSTYLEPPGSPTNTPFIQLNGVGATGNHYEIIFAHPSQIIFSPVYNEKTIIGMVGNYGMVSPEPSPANPFAGSHLHLGIKVNGVWRDPLEYFDIESPYVGPPHDPANDIPRLTWAIAQLEAQITALAATIHH